MGAEFDAELTVPDCVEPVEADVEAVGAVDDVELRTGGVGGFRPAVLEPRPIFWRLVASSLPLAFKLFAD